MSERGNDRNNHVFYCWNNAVTTKRKPERSSCILFLLASEIFYFVPIRFALALDPSRPPSINFDLSHWHLQLPTSGGVLTGTAGPVDTASTAQAAAGFTNACFYTGTDGGMIFWTPDNGAATSGSTHPRSELIRFYRVEMP